MHDLIEGRFWVSRDEKSFLGSGRIELLKHIDQTGSINKAAQVMKMSYKAAWDAVDAMNTLADQPLVERMTGGKGGGGTRLTEYAKEVIAAFDILKEEHEHFLHNLSLRMGNKQGQVRLLERMALRTSARNQLFGKVVKIDKGSLNSRVSLELDGGEVLEAIITSSSIKSLDLTIGIELYALFKSNAVQLSSQFDTESNVSNRFKGVIHRISQGDTHTEIVIKIGGKNTIVSTLKRETFDSAKLEEGSEVVAFCDPDSILLGAL